MDLEVEEVKQESVPSSLKLVDAILVINVPICTRRGDSARYNRDIFITFIH